MEKKNISPSEIASREHEIIVEFNKRLHSGKYSGEECYRWLNQKKEELKADVERLYLVNHDFFYNFARLDSAKKCEEMELLFKHNICSCA